MAHYRKEKTRPSCKSPAHASKSAIVKPSSGKPFKLKIYGSFFALVLLLAILYGRAEHYTSPKQNSSKQQIDYSRRNWAKQFNKLTAIADPIPQNSSEIESLVLILKEYSYWENEVHLAREAKDKKKEKSALHSYQKTLDKISRYSNEAIKNAEQELERSGWNPAQPSGTDR